MFCSCNKKISETFFKAQRNLQICDKIVECINTKNSRNLCALFSENVRNVQPDLATNAEEMFSYLGGKVINYEEFGITENFSKEGFQKKICYYSTFKLSINDETFIMDYIYILKNDFNVGDEGINSLKIIRESDKEQYFCYFPDLQPGIFLPKK